MPADPDLLSWIDDRLAEHGLRRTGRVVPFREWVWGLSGHGGDHRRHGDAVVSHPFAALLTPLRASPTATRDRLRDSYLDTFGDPGTLRAEAELAVRVALVARALVWVRALGKHSERHEHATAPLDYLRQLLD